MYIPDEKFSAEASGPNGCFWPDNSEDGCVVNWGCRSYLCQHLRGIQYKGSYYAVDTPGFYNCTFFKDFGDDEIDYSELYWDCSYK